MPFHNPFFLIGASTAGAALNLASASDLYTFTIPCKCRLLRASVNLITAISSSGAVVVEFDRTPHNAGTREDACIQITIPTTATTAGNVYYDEPSTEKILYEGDIVTLQVATAAVTSGTGTAYLTCDYIPETAANNAYLHEV